MYAFVALGSWLASSTGQTVQATNAGSGYTTVNVLTQLQSDSHGGERGGV